MRRGLPLVAAAALALWARRRLGAGALDPAPLVSLIAVCLALRVVFEEGLFGYKLLVLVVMVVLVAVVSGRITAELMSWLALVTLAYTSLPARLSADGLSYGHAVVAAVEIGAILAFVGALAWELSTHRVIRRRALVGLVLVPVLVVHWLPMAGSLPAPLPKWFLQLVLVGSGTVLAGRPLLAAVRAAGAPAAGSRTVPAFVPAAAGAITPTAALGIVPADERRRAWLAGRGAPEPRVSLE